jgi:hypothetical protein
LCDHPVNINSSTLLCPHCALIEIRTVRAENINLTSDLFRANKQLTVVEKQLEHLKSHLGEIMTLFNNSNKGMLTQLNAINAIFKTDNTPAADSTTDAEKALMLQQVAELEKVSTQPAAPVKAFSLKSELINVLQKHLNPKVITGGRGFISPGYEGKAGLVSDFDSDLARYTYMDCLRVKIGFFADSETFKTQFMIDTEAGLLMFFDIQDINNNTVLINLDLGDVSKLVEVKHLDDFDSNRQQADRILAALDKTLLQYM